MKRVDILSSRSSAVFAALALALAPVTGLCEEEATPGQAIVPPWYAVAAGGWFDFEGDQELDDGAVLSGGIGYNFNDKVAVEAMLFYAPDLEVSDSWRAADITEDSTYALGIAAEGLFHFTPWKRVDPYIAAGLGYTHYGTELQYGKEDDVVFRGGGGMFYHFNDEWAVRADYRGMLADFGGHPSANSTLTLGINWTWGVKYPPRTDITGIIDTDADGLPDADEINIYRTDPNNPDTDGDGLTDYEEVKIYGTNPLEPDTDLDMLKDGEEVHHYKTDPLVQDTDKGGVSDGHEVIEDSTDPLDPTDDLLLFSLNIEFDTDKSVIKPDYFNSLNVIGKVLTRTPSATAKIEGHADKRQKSSRPYNINLSHRRADSVMSYLKQQCNIDGSRLRAKGYGFDRPVAKNDPVNGNQRNRRVDVYVEGVDNGYAAKNDASSQGNASSAITYDTAVMPPVESAPTSKPAPTEDDMRVIK